MRKNNSGNYSKSFQNPEAAKKYDEFVYGDMSYDSFIWGLQKKILLPIIENLKGKLTVFVIAHRLSTIINSDRLLVLEKGRIIEEAPPHVRVLYIDVKGFVRSIKTLTKFALYLRKE